MSDIPIVMTATGVQPQNPIALQQQLIANVAATNPGYTANLPGSLVEDISSTDVGAMALIDSAWVETVNSLTPYGANLFLLNQLGQIYLGQQNGGQGKPTNNSVYVTISGPPGFPIAVGFTVSDGTYQYTVQDGGIIGSNGMALPLYCLATQPGSWAIPLGTVTQIVTSVPSPIVLTVTNAAAGVQGLGAELAEAYRARVLQAGLAASQGMGRYLKTLLAQVPGVQPRLISVQPLSGQWRVICGGGDPYQVANAIWMGIGDTSNLTGSQLAVSNITQSNPGVVATNLAHGLVSGTIQTLTGIVGMTALNGVALTITVLTPTTFSIGINTTGYGIYVSGGSLSPNPRNISVSINDYPDTYLIPFVNPPLQNVGVSVTWNTAGTNYVADSAIAQLAAQPLVDYINGIYVSQPINVFEMQNIFQSAISSVIPPTLLSRMVFSVTINGLTVSPTAGTGLIVGDPESYFQTSVTSVAIARG